MKMKRDNGGEHFLPCEEVSRFPYNSVCPLKYQLNSGSGLMTNLILTKSLINEFLGDHKLSCLEENLGGSILGPSPFHFF